MWLLAKAAFFLIIAASARAQLTGLASSPPTGSSFWELYSAFQPPPGGAAEAGSLGAPSSSGLSGATPSPLPPPPPPQPSPTAPSLLGLRLDSLTQLIDTLSAILRGSPAGGAGTASPLRASLTTVIDTLSALLSGSPAGAGTASRLDGALRNLIDALSVRLSASSGRTPSPLGTSLTSLIDTLSVLLGGSPPGAGASPAGGGGSSLLPPPPSPTQPPLSPGPPPPAPAARGPLDFVAAGGQGPGSGSLLSGGLWNLLDTAGPLTAASQQPSRQQQQRKREMIELVSLMILLDEL